MELNSYADNSRNTAVQSETAVVIIDVITVDDNVYYIDEFLLNFTANIVGEFIFEIFKNNENNPSSILSFIFI